MQSRETTFISEALIFKALMHPTRIALLEALREGEQCVCRLEEALAMPQAYISQQLAVLRRVRLIADRRRGLNIFYRIAKPEVLQMIRPGAHDGEQRCSQHQRRNALRLRVRTTF